MVQFGPRRCCLLATQEKEILDPRPAEGRARVPFCAMIRGAFWTTRHQISLPSINSSPRRNSTHHNLLHSPAYKPCASLSTRLLPQAVKSSVLCPAFVLSLSLSLSLSLLQPCIHLYQLPVAGMDRVRRLASQRAVVVFSLSSCCMCHTVKRLFCELGVNPAVHELDEDPRGKDMERALAKMLGRSPPVPAVFIGGNLVGPTDEVMALHLGGKLVPLLRNAGALWL